MTAVKALRCAIYTRVSSDAGLEQDFNSLQAQREAAEAYIKSQAHEGWRLRRERYDDGGYSGGSMERPALQQLLADVAELCCVEDGAQAVAAFDQAPFDMILMDMQMPVMDGLTALRKIRWSEQERSLSRTPAIMLTANALPEHIASALAAGADVHLSKPFTAGQVFDAIEDALAPPAKSQLTA